MGSTGPGAQQQCYQTKLCQGSNFTWMIMMATMKKIIVAMMTTVFDDGGEHDDSF